MIDHVGQHLGNYRLVRLLGQGGFADVYLGEHIYLRTFAAIKLLQLRLVNEDLQNFLAEARTIASLDHPHIVRVLDFGVQDSVPFLVMSYAPNGTVRGAYPRGTRLPPGLIVSYVKQVADALQFAHSRHLIHRDIKPENMLLGPKQELLLSDFGIALTTQSSRYESTHEVVGTTAYMAPEQLQGKPRPATDQYALGIVVYEWLSGDRPFHGSFFEMYSQHMFVPPPSLREKDPAIPPAVEQVVLTALAKDPQQRFPTIMAFASALEQSYMGATAPLHQVSGIQTIPPPPQALSTVIITPSTQIALSPAGAMPAPQTPLPAFATVPAPQTPPPPLAAISPPQTPLPAVDPDTQHTGPSQKGVSRRKVLAVAVGVSAAGIAASSFVLFANMQRPPSSSTGKTPTSTTNAGGTPGQKVMPSATGTRNHQGTATPVQTSKSGPTSTSGTTSGGTTPGSDPTAPTGATWKPTGNLLLARSRFRATTLPDGVILVEGGALPSGYTAECEIYNPVSGSWSLTGSMNQARSGHTATVLSGGSVLVTGGLTGSALSSAELFLPLSGVWKLTGSMTQPRTRHTATLVNGQVLVCGGWNNGNMTSSCEIYNPSHGTWTPVASMYTPRADHSALLLSDGGVLVVGGAPSNGGYTAEAEVYNPSANSWTVIKSMNVPRSDFAMLFLRNGQVLVIGGITPNGQTTSAELYNQSTGNWTLTGSMHNPRAGLRDQNAVLLADGTVMMAAGDGILGTSEIYNPATGTWSAPVSMNQSHCDGATASFGGGRVLVVGGYDCNSVNNKVAATEMYM